jgi:hypothetical protein
MHRGIYGLLGVAAALGLAVSCKDDPTSTLRGGPALLTLEFDYREVVIRDSVKVTAIVRDEQNNPLPVPITVSIPSNCTAGIASVAPTSAAPLPITAFFLKGLAYGTTCVVAQSNGLSDTMQVATFPARIAVIGPDTMLSGTSLQFGYSFFDAVGNVITGPPPPTWETTDALIAAVNATGLVAAKDPGQARVTATGVGSPEGGINFGRTFVVKAGPFAGVVVPSPAYPGQTVNITHGTAPAFDANSQVLFNGTAQTLALNTPDSVRVAIPDLTAPAPVSMLLRRLGATETAVSGSFNLLLPAIEGTVTPAAAVPTDTLQIARGTGPLFDADTRAYVRGVRTFIIPTSANQIGVVVPGIGTTGKVELRLTRLDAGNVARRDSITSSTATFVDHYDAVNDDPTTGPAITANGDYYVVMHGTCDNGAVTDPGDDCDDFFTITNPGGVEDTLTVQLDWFTNADVDILWLNAGGTGFVGNFAGATGANPELSTVRVPAGATWRLWVNFFAPGAPSTIVRVRVTGKN